MAKIQTIFVCSYPVRGLIDNDSSEQEGKESLEKREGKNKEKRRVKEEELKRDGRMERTEGKRMKEHKVIDVTKTKDLFGLSQIL